MRGLVLALAAILAFGGAALAESAPAPVPADRRIRTVTFKKDEVVLLLGTMGVSTMIVFGEGEHIATVALGDSQSWQAVPDASKQYLYIKPIERYAITNMNVVTSKRIYNFVLKSVPPGSASVVYKVRFRYLDDAEDAALLSKAKDIAANPNRKFAEGRADKVNLAYGFKGSAENKPDGMFDDGVKTYFRFSGDAPAIFEVLPGGDETLINYHREGEVLVVDKVAAQWTLRAGDEATCVFNLNATAIPASAKDVTAINDPPPDGAAPTNAAAVLPATPGTPVHVRY